LYNDFFVSRNHTIVRIIKIGKITRPRKVPFLLFSKESKNTIVDFIYKIESIINNMSEEKEFLILILKKLDNVSKSIQELNERVDRLEGKTDDLHNYIPFVGWLEAVGRDLSGRFTWLRGHHNPPTLISNKPVGEFSNLII
jgi:hypothetical protein